MSLLLDTTAISEITKPRPNPGFMEWFVETAEPQDRRKQVFVSVLVSGELDKGVLKLEDGERRRALSNRRDLVLATYADRILPIDLNVASRWAEVTDRHRRAVRTVGAVDELIAATALVHDLTVVTRNVRHFEHSGCRVLSPWSA